jgi:hypothetical protein
MAFSAASHPFRNIPAVGEPVTNLALADSLGPLLHGTASLLDGLAHADVHNTLSERELSEALVLLCGLLTLACEVFDRWASGEDASLS